MKNDIPVFTLDAVTHAMIPMATKVISKSSAEHYVYIYTGPEYNGVNFKLYQIDEMTETGPVELLFADILEHECGRPWYKLRFDALNQNPGHHLYRFHFVDVCTGATVSLFVSYILQDDNPDKPYIYMKRDEEATNE